jgi:hypothetical protein
MQILGEVQRFARETNQQMEPQSPLPLHQKLYILPHLNNDLLLRAVLLRNQLDTTLPGKGLALPTATPIATLALVAPLDSAMLQAVMILSHRLLWTFLSLLVFSRLVLKSSLPSPPCPRRKACSCFSTETIKSRAPVEIPK